MTDQQERCPHNVIRGTHLECGKCAEDERGGSVPAGPEPSAEVTKAYDVARRILMCEPQENGEYAHLLICSGDRRQPPGTRGISCCCPIAPRKSQSVELTALREAAQRLVSAYDDGGRDPERALSEAVKALRAHLLDEGTDT